MGTRSRIRWHKVAKLALAVLGCLALFAGLPSLIRRPEPLPLDPDIGLAPLAASRVPARSVLRPEPGPQRHAAKGADRRAAKGTHRHRRRVHARRPARHEQEPPSTASPVAGVSAPAPVSVTPAGPTTAVAPPPAPPPPAPPPARAPASPATASEFGFER